MCVCVLKFETDRINLHIQIHIFINIVYAAMMGSNLETKPPSNDCSQMLTSTDVLFNQLGNYSG